MNKFGKLLAGSAVVLGTLFAAGCDQSASKIASHNLSKAADEFEITRRIVFYNGFTGEYMLSLEGRCSIEDQSKQLEVTCKTGSGTNDFKKHFLGLSDNVTYFVEQLESANVSTFHYRVIFKPQSIIPSIDLEASLKG